jgi:hypothetical protein
MARITAVATALVVLLAAAPASGGHVAEFDCVRVFRPR